MRSVLIALAALLFVSGCTAIKEWQADPADRVEGYAELCQSSEEAQVRCAAYDLGGRYYVAQSLVLAVVQNPETPVEVKDVLKELDSAAASAVATYVKTVAVSGDDIAAKRLAALQALVELQAALAEAQVQ